MRKAFILISVLMLASLGLAQNTTIKPDIDVFVPSTLTAGTSMTARVAATTLDDTTRAFTSRGYAGIAIGLETSVNDSASLYVAYQFSKDGSVWSAFAVVDSFIASGLVGASKYVPLPTQALYAQQVRARVYGSSWGDYSPGTTTKVTTKVIRVPYSSSKVK